MICDSTRHICGGVSFEICGDTLHWIHQRFRLAKTPKDPPWQQRLRVQWALRVQRVFPGIERVPNLNCTYVMQLLGMRYTVHCILVTSSYI